MRNQEVGHIILLFEPRVVQRSASHVTRLIYIDTSPQQQFDRSLISTLRSNMHKMIPI